MRTYVYRLKATFRELFTPGPDHCPGTMTKETTTVFATREIAASRVEKFRAKIREMTQEPDLEINVEIIPMELISSLEETP